MLIQREDRSGATRRVACLLAGVTLTAWSGLSFITSASSVTTTHTSTIQTQLGPVHGRCDVKAGCQWLNIPFAEPMTRRFEASRPRRSTYGGGVGSPDRYGPACIQEFVHGVVGQQSEDCLQLNIFAPASALSSAAPLPVMVWIYGGGFLTGSAGVNYNGLTYNGSRLTSHGVLVVTLQYRVGLLGFLQQSDGSGGANGFGDMLSALRWVRQHIGAFNGDARSVTIFGESAGSTACCVLAHLPSARGLFHRVIAESGVCYPSGDAILSRADGARVRARLLELLGLPPSEEGRLLSMDAQELVERTRRALVPPGALDTFSPLFTSGIGAPSVDGDVLPDATTRLTPLPVDLIHGFNSGEVLMAPPQGIPGGALAFFSEHLGGRDVASRVLEQYGPRLPPDADLIADACFRCTSVRFARRVAAGRGVARFYVFDNPPGASFHGADVPAVWGTADVLTMPDGSVNTSERLVNRVQSIWTTFAKGGDVGRLVPQWPAVPARADGGTLSSVRAMTLGDREGVLRMDTSRCAAWEAATDALGGFATARMCMDFYRMDY